MAEKTNIVLLGFMGTGKTTVGRLLAGRLQKTLVDMDEIIAERQGKSIQDIFEEDGEERFRKLEYELVQELAAREHLIVATGGGVVLDVRNIEEFNRTGLSVCLMADHETILRRVKAETHRPLLEDGDKARRIIDILESRRPLYEAIPHRIDTSDLPADKVAEQIIKMFRA